MKRIATALVLVPLVVALVLWAPEWALIGALAVVGVLAYLEYLRIVRHEVLPAILGMFYVFGPLYLAILLRNLSPQLLMFALLLSWAGDTVAMYVGKSIGRHKLAPVISPNKTWEGAIGSVVGSLLCGGGYLLYFFPTTALAHVLTLALAGNVAGQLGDLFESWLKRQANIKDSGSSLPGHGGWLDRIDAMLFTLPIVYIVFRIWLWVSPATF